MSQSRSSVFHSKEGVRLVKQLKKLRMGVV